MIEIVPYDSNGNDITELAQWDKLVTIYLNHSLITKASDVHLSNYKTGTATVVSSTYSSKTLTVTIPSALLQTAGWIYGYIYLENSTSARSILNFNIKVIARAKPADYDS